MGSSITIKERNVWNNLWNQIYP